jgi:hypothetical protein
MNFSLSSSTMNSSLSSQKVTTKQQPTNYYDDLFNFARAYNWLIEIQASKSKRRLNSAALKVDNVDNFTIDVDDDVVSYLMSRRDVRLRRHEIKPKKIKGQINLKKK